MGCGVVLWCGFRLVLFILVLVFLTLIFIVVGFRFTHQVAGALYHFKKTFDDIEASGELKELNLRDQDFFHDVQASFNKMIKKPVNDAEGFERVCQKVYGHRDAYTMNL